MSLKAKMQPPLLKAFILAGLGLLLIIFGIFLWYPNSKYYQPENSQPVLSDNSGISLESNQLKPDLNLSGTDEHKLVITKIGVDMPISFGDNEQRALLSGAWHIPGSGTPDMPDGYKNIVLSGHRYLYTSGPNTFFNLDKLEKGDQITLRWQGQVYEYAVDHTLIVEPEDVWILNDDGKPKLTLFTCTPVYTTKQRLVVVAYPIN